MPSPFPGMDPFLEEHWGDVHTSLTTYARDQLRLVLPIGLSARVEEFVHMEIGDSTDAFSAVPDVRVIERTILTTTRVEPGSQTVVTATPVLVPLQEEWTERWIQIHDRERNRLVTVIEFLSPGNKRSRGQREAFSGKQEELRKSGINVVEIDLLRRGGWALSAPEPDVPDDCAYPYRVCVVRASHPDRAECYQVPLQQPLPSIRIPLRLGEPDAPLQLQPLLDAAWENGDYAAINYSTAPRAPFRPDDEVWIEHRIAAWKAAQL